MLQTKDLLDHIDALLRLSHDAGDRAIAAKLRQLADEFRIMVSVADISNLAATLGKPPALAAAPSPFSGPPVAAAPATPAPSPPVLAAPMAAVPAPEVVIAEVTAADTVRPEGGAKKAPVLAWEDDKVEPSRLFHARYAGSNGTFACSRVGAP
jgi:hypothetical protein